MNLYGYRYIGLKTAFQVNLSREDKRLLTLLHECASEEEKNIFTKVGKEVMGILLLGYSQWLNRLKAEVHSDAVLFLAREGKLLKESYEIVYPLEESGYYIHLSRLSLCRALASQARDYEELRKIFEPLLRGVKSVQDFMKILGIDKRAKYVYGKFDIDESSYLNAVDRNTLFSLVRAIGGDFFNKQYEYVYKYVLSCGVKKSGTVIVSDIGWSGSMQLALSKLFPSVTFVGAYLACSDTYNDYDYSHLDKRGYLCSKNEWKRIGQMLRFTQSAMETLFLGEEGTTLYFELINGNVVPVLGESHHVNGLSELHCSALDSVKEIKQICEENGMICIGRDCALIPYINFAVFPGKMTIEFFSQFIHKDGISASAFLPRNGMLYYVMNRNALRKELEGNNSKIIWLRALTHVQFPYYLLLLLLTKKFGMKSEFEKEHIETINYNAAKR